MLFTCRRVHMYCLSNLARELTARGRTEGLTVNSQHGEGELFTCQKYLEAKLTPWIRHSPNPNSNFVACRVYWLTYRDIFIPTALNAGRSSREKGVRLSVRQMRGLWQNGRKICPDFYTIRKIHLALFSKKKNGRWGSTPSTWNYVSASLLWWRK